MKKHRIIKVLLSVLLYALPAHAQYSAANMQKVHFSRNNSGDIISDMHVGDFNKDGNIDLVLDGGLPWNGSGTVEFNSKPIFFLGDGAGKLAPATSTFTHTGTTALICDVADYDKDGFEDILVTDFWANGMRLYNGGAGLKFTLAHTLPTGTHGAKGCFKDMDGDGDLDIVNVSSGSAAVVALHVFTNTGTGFNKGSYPTANDRSFAPSLYVADLNRDGKKDVFAISSERLINVWIQTPNGYAHSSEVPDWDMHDEFNQRRGYWMDDANNDGEEDLIFLKEALINKAQANVAYAEPTAPYFGTNLDDSGSVFMNFLGDFKQTVITGDVDNDGTNDMITFNRHDHQIAIVTDPLNKKGNFMMHTLHVGTANIKARGYGLLLADLNKDGDLELISAGQDDTLRIFDNMTKTTEISPIVSRSNSFTFYPNPASDKLYIDLEELDESRFLYIAIYDVNGKLQQTINKENWKNEVPIASLPVGTYLLSLKMDNGETYSKMFSKQ